MPGWKKRLVLPGALVSSEVLCVQLFLALESKVVVDADVVAMMSKLKSLNIVKVK